MKSNSHTVLETMELFSHDVREAENTLRYALHLNDAFQSIPKQYPDLTNANISNVIDTLANTIMDDCNNFIDVAKFDFFGFPCIYKSSDDSAHFNDLSILHSRDDFWLHVFKQDAILFTFNNLRKIIGESYIMNTSERVRISNYTNSEMDGLTSFDIIHHGLDYLTYPSDGNQPSPPWYSLTTTTKDTLRPTLCREGCRTRINADSCDAYISNAPNYRRRIDTLTNRLLDAGLNMKPLYYTSAQKKSSTPEYALSVLEFYDFLVSRTATTTDYSSSIVPLLHGYTAGKSFTDSSYHKYIESIHKLLVNINAKDIDKGTIDFSTALPHKLLSSDKIYLRYQIEKIFAPTTIDCIYQNIHATNNTYCSLCDQSSIDLISSCLQLPNVFTRQYILQMAVDIISKHYDYNFRTTTFLSKKTESSNILMRYSHARTDAISEFTKLDTWKAQFRNMINYLTQLAFPIYENYFFCVLWSTVKNSDPTSTDAQIVIKLYKLLQHYLNTPCVVENLFNTENIIINSEPSLKGFDASKIIKPNFTCGHKIGHQSNSIDVRLYKSCLLAHTLSFKKEPLPEFISLSYLAHPTSEIKKNIQNMYILEAAKSK